MQNGSSEGHIRRWWEESTFQIVVMVLLFSIAAITESFRLSSFGNPEIWGHLRVGSWILENKRWPQTGLFSQAANQPWMDFSWGYALVAAMVYKGLGLRAVPSLLMCFRVGLAVVTFVLAGGRRNFWGAVALSAVAQYVLASVGPGSVCASVILFGCELYLLVESRKAANLRLLYILPALFLCWANLDLGFVYGVALYAVFVVVLVFEAQGWGGHWQRPAAPTRGLSVGAALLIGFVCIAASLLNPYGYQGYAQFFANQTSGVNNYLPEYSAMSFHQPQHYVLMLLALTACFALGLRRIYDLFPIAVLLGCMALAFYSERNDWLLTLSAVTLIGQAMLPEPRMEPLRPRFTWKMAGPAACGISMVIVTLAFLVQVPRDSQALLAKAGKWYPVRATDFIRRHQLPAPLFNSYAWGGFLTWYLPEYPVAIDGRRGLYSEQEAIDYFKAMKADIPYQTFAPMTLAQTLLLDKTGVMGDALRGLPGFQVAYEDEISIVLLHPSSK
jgi:hypothetical protein